MTGELGAVDLGGSHVAAALLVDGIPTRVVQRRFESVEASTARTLDSIADCLVEAGSAARWIVAAPGPFDYERGVCRIAGLSKLNELFDVNLRTELSNRIPDTRFDFVNDAHSAGLGEWARGAGEKSERMLYVGLGTGLGSAFISNGVVVAQGDRVPPGGHLGLTPFRSGLADDYCSTRGLLASSRHRDTRLIMESARSGSNVDLTMLAEFGASLEEVVTPWQERFDPLRIVVGGGLSHGFDLISRGFTNPEPAGLWVAATHPHDAALYGAGVVADQ